MSLLSTAIESVGLLEGRATIKELSKKDIDAMHRYVADLTHKLETQ